MDPNRRAVTGLTYNTCLFAPEPYYKQNKGCFLDFLFKQFRKLRPPRGLNEKASEKYPLLITKSDVQKKIDKKGKKMTKYLEN